MQTIKLPKNFSDTWAFRLGSSWNAVEDLFDVRVAEVRIINRKGKPQLRYGRVVSHRKTVRKAYVKLAAGEKTPEFFEAI